MQDMPEATHTITTSSAALTATLPPNVIQFPGTNATAWTAAGDQIATAVADMPAELLLTVGANAARLALQDRDAIPKEVFFNRVMGAYCCMQRILTNAGRL
jgi:hypothetical protein